MSRAKDLATMIFRCSAGYVRKAVARHLPRGVMLDPHDLHLPRWINSIAVN